VRNIGFYIVSPIGKVLVKEILLKVIPFKVIIFKVIPFNYSLKVML
jgi:hypothetical protein